MSQNRVANDDRAASPLEPILNTLQEVWKHLGPWAAPAAYQAQKLLQPVLDNLPPQAKEALAGVNSQLQGHLQSHEPMTILLTGAVGTLLLLRLLGVLKRFTTILLMGLASAYVWPYVQEHFLKK
ncbi:g3986 [Coccomyxa viridis]|uniref:G3986 protein n=1 Tax=Coccomyxa viridis TaxID=1274662 RepID=A0ABP1FUF7_9CHLO